MSILNENPISKQSQSKKRAERIEFLTENLIDVVARYWDEVWDLIWNTDESQEVLNHLGGNAQEALELHEEALIFLSNSLGGRKQAQLDQILEKVARQPKTSENTDGTTTII